jgi:CRP-like cAMP-binding protein
MEAAHVALAEVLEKAGWPRSLADELARHTHVVTYERNATVFHTGEPADLFYVLLSGDAKLYFSAPDEERLLVSIGRGAQILAFPDLDAGEPRGMEGQQFFTAQTLSRCTVAIMTRARVASALAKLPGTQLVRVLQGVQHEWMALSSRVLRLLTMSVRRRLAYVLVEMANTFGSPDAHGTLITLKLSHDDLAALVAASRPMVSKHLKEMVSAGLLRRENARYIVPRLDELTSLADRAEPAPPEPAPCQAVSPASLLKAGDPPRRPNGTAT